MIASKNKMKGSANLSLRINNPFTEYYIKVYCVTFIGKYCNNRTKTTHSFICI